LIIITAAVSLVTGSPRWGFALVLAIALFGAVAAMVLLDAHILSPEPPPQTSVSCGGQRADLPLLPPCENRVFDADIGPLQANLVERGFELGSVSGAAFHPRLGLKIILPVLLLLVLLSGYQVLRLRFGPWSAAGRLVATAAGIYLLMVLLALGQTR
jgi:hypothetical protein